MVCYDSTIFGRDTTIWIFGIWGCKKNKNKNNNNNNNLNTEKIAFKVVQIKLLAMHITDHKLSWYIYGVKFTKYLHGMWSLLIF